MVNKIAETEQMRANNFGQSNSEMLIVDSIAKLEEEKQFHQKENDQRGVNRQKYIVPLLHVRENLQQREAV